MSKKLIGKARQKARKKTNPYNAKKRSSNIDQKLLQQAYDKGPDHMWDSPEWHKLNGSTGGDACSLLIISKKDGKIREFQHGEVIIPNRCKQNRDELIGGLGRKWGHNNTAIILATMYLAESPSLQMVRKQGSELFKVMSGKTGPHELDLDNLGCVIEFEVTPGVGAGTDGPLWRSADEVREYAKEVMANHKLTHSIQSPDGKVQVPA